MSEANRTAMPVPGAATVFESVIPLLGRLVVFRSNDARVIALFEESFGFWRKLAPECGGPAQAAVSVTVVPEEADSDEVEFDLPNPDVLLLSGRGLAARAERSSCAARAEISVSRLGSPAALRYLVLEALALFLLTGSDRLPVHASGIVQDGVALIIMGPSGTGKSSIAHAAFREGWQVLAEDVVYLEPGNPLRIWGGVSRVYLPVDRRGHESVLDGLGVTVLPNGKSKLVVELPEQEFPPMPLTQGALCFIRKGPGAVSWRPLSPSETRDLLHQPAEGGFARHEGETRVQLEQLAGAGSFLLELSTDPYEAVAAIGEIFGIVTGQQSF